MKFALRAFPGDHLRDLRRSRQPLPPGHGERSRLQLHAKLGGQENSLILAVNVLAVNVLAVNPPVPLFIVSKSAFCTLNSVKKRVAHPIYSVFYALSVLFEVVAAGAQPWRPAGPARCAAVLGAGRTVAATRHAVRLVAGHGESLRSQSN